MPSPYLTPWVLAILKPDTKKQYDEIIETISPMDKERLDKFIQAVWYAAIDAAEEVRDA
jgi:hypothetical protein